jgi:predicted amidophosphoribosyltransferase
LAGRLALLVQTNEKLQGNQKYISFIPSHRRRKYLEKGYNQSELLAKELANQLEFPILSLAKKQRYTVSQLQLQRAQRTNNLKSVFVAHHLEAIPHNAIVLFVDDVTTTGSTLLEIAKVVKKGRPDVKIWGAVVARNMQ